MYYISQVMIQSNAALSPMVQHQETYVSPQPTLVWTYIERKYFPQSYSIEHDDVVFQGDPSLSERSAHL
jgi:hypothetical protein